MRYPEVKKELKIAFENFLKPEGYKTKMTPTGSEFVKINGDVRTEIMFSVTNFYDVFYSGFNFYLSFDSLNKLRDKIGVGKTDVHLSTNSAIYFGNINYSYEIKSQNDIEKWIKLVEKFYYECAISIIEKFEGLESLEMYLNEDLKVILKYHQGYEGRIENGLILSKLIKPQYYEKLKQTYLEDLESKKIERQMALKRAIVTTEVYDPFESIYKTIEYLDNHSSEDLNLLLKDYR